MTLPEYVHDHLIDLDLMSKSEISDLIMSTYNELAKPSNFLNAQLIDLLVDLNSKYNQDGISWICRNSTIPSSFKSL